MADTTLETPVTSAVPEAAVEGTIADSATTKARVAAPDEVTFKASLEDMRCEIEAANQELATIRANIDKGSQGNQKSVAELASARQALQEAKAATRAKINARNELHQQQDAQRAGRDASWEALQQIKSSLRYQSIEQIEEAVANLEFQLMSSTRSLKEEKRLVGEISTLNGQKPAVREYMAQLEAHKKDKDGNKEIGEQIKALNTEISVLRDAEKVKSSIVDGVQKRMDGSRRRIHDLIKAQKKLRDEHFKAKDIWYASQQEHRKKLQAEKQKQHEEYMKRKAEEKAEQEKELAEIHPYELEMQICDNITAYLTSLLPSQPIVEAATTTTATGNPDLAVPEPRAPETGPPMPEGAFRVGKHKGGEDEEEDGFFGGSTKKKGKKGRRRNKNLVEAANQTGIKHPLDVFSDFTSISVDPPLFMKDVPAVVESVKARKQYYSAAPPKPKRERPVMEEKKEEKKEKKEEKVEEVDGPTVVEAPTAVPTWVKKKEGE